MLSIFSFSCWPSVCFLWRNVYLGLLPIFWLSCLIFWCWAVSIFWKLSMSVVSFANIFFPFCMLAFHFCLWFPKIHLGYKVGDIFPIFFSLNIYFNQLFLMFTFAYLAGAALFSYKYQKTKGFLIFGILGCLITIGALIIYLI